MSMNAEAEEIFGFINGFLEENGVHMYFNPKTHHKEFVTIQTIVNTTANAAYQDGYTEGRKYENLRIRTLVEDTLHLKGG